MHNSWYTCSGTFAFTVQINLLLNHLTLWDSSSVREMSSLLLFLSSKCFKCFLRFLCFLWDLCFRWPCFLSLDFGDSGWPTVFVDRGDMLGSLCSMNWIVLRVSVGAIFSFRSIPFTWLGSVLEQVGRQSSSYPSLITGAGGRAWDIIIIIYYYWFLL